MLTTNAVRRCAVRVPVALLIAAFVVTIPAAESAFAAAPTISSFTPTSGPIGTSVQISGSGFGDASDVTTVTFNGTAATFTIDSNVQITATVPAGATDGSIAVTDSEGTATSATSFDVTASPVPTITSFNPTSGPVGTSVVITGTGFTGTSGVTFNGTTATFTVNSNTQITATVPAGATDGSIAVTTPGGTATSATGFDVTASPVPTITSFSPDSGDVGTSVVITGTGFTGATAVSFGGTAATTFTVNSDTRITATVPAGAATGPITVTTPGGTATSANNFTVSGAVERHERTITLDLRRHLVARGRVTVNDGFDACESGVTVMIQRRRPNGAWRTVETDQTDGDGLYRERIRDRVGVYRAVAVREVLNGGDDVCVRDRSPRARHHH
jgi:hypothetical protein